MSPFFSFHAKTGIYEPWNCSEQLSLHRLHGVLPQTPTFQELLEKTSTAKLSLRQQSDLLNAISNDSSPSGRSGMSYYAYFSTGNCNDASPAVSKYLPTSQRNIVLYRWRLGQTQQAVAALHEVEDMAVRKQPIASTTRRAERAARTQPAADVNHALLNEDDVPGHFTVDSTFSQSPFHQFSCELIEEKGVASWRIYAIDLDIIAMNDICLDGGGRYLENAFVHVSLYVSGGSVLYHCQCHMYNVKLRRGEPGLCVHIRFFKEYMEPHYHQLFSSTCDFDQSNDSSLKRKIMASLLSLNVGVAQLGNHPRYRRFSILSPDMRSAAIAKMQNGRIVCHFGECRARRGHSRKLTRINEPVFFPHPRLLCAHEQLWDSPAELVTASDSDGTDSSETDGELQEESLHQQQSQNKVNKTMCDFLFVWGFITSLFFNSLWPRGAKDLCQHWLSNGFLLGSTKPLP